MPFFCNPCRWWLFFILLQNPIFDWFPKSTQHPFHFISTSRQLLLRLHSKPHSFERMCLHIRAGVRCLRWRGICLQCSMMTPRCCLSSLWFSSHPLYLSISHWKLYYLTALLILGDTRIKYPCKHHFPVVRPPCFQMTLTAAWLLPSTSVVMIYTLLSPVTHGKPHFPFFCSLTTASTLPVHLHANTFSLHLVNCSNQFSTRCLTFCLS